MTLRIDTLPAPGSNDNSNSSQQLKSLGRGPGTNGQAIADAVDDTIDSSDLLAHSTTSTSVVTTPTTPSDFFDDEWVVGVVTIQYKQPDHPLPGHLQYKVGANTVTLSADASSVSIDHITGIVTYTDAGVVKTWNPDSVASAAGNAREDLTAAEQSDFDRLMNQGNVAAAVWYMDIASRHNFSNASMGMIDRVIGKLGTDASDADQEGFFRLLKILQEQDNAA